MAWDTLPASPGDLITAAMFNEIRTAIDERSDASGTSVAGTLPATKSDGDLITAADIYNFAQSIETLIDDQRWYYLSWYTDYDTYTIELLTTGADNPSSTPPEKNIFKLAFGTADTDWRHEAQTTGTAGLLLTADIVNDFRLVLNRMVRVTPDADSSVATKRSREVGPEASYADVETALEAEAWATPGPVATSLPSRLNLWNPPAGSYYGEQIQEAHCVSFTLTGNVTDVFKNTPLAWDTPGRDVVAYWRTGTAAAPASYLGHRTYGTQRLTHTFAEGTADGEYEAGNPAEFNALFRVTGLSWSSGMRRMVWYADCDDVSDAGLSSGGEEFAYYLKGRTPAPDGIFKKGDGYLFAYNFAKD
jgi:hypothetical protein